ncbi:hypothetical protein INT43_004619 [Umbelopsis isabellina]|uniref:PIN domain-containing protein n=1 Tax=Mortierella isabellina TaxID=91625 RepID=A0A8H7PGG4_MORIS|nr:hypothetical protein INT43_004619 [Umbelopsis isabellina]
MHSNEDYMDEDGPEFIAMINDLVRNVRSESQAHQPTSHLPDRKLNDAGIASPQTKLSKKKSMKKGHDNFKQSITTSKNLKKHLESLVSTTCDVDQEETFIVVDTNILISHQDHLKSLIADIEQRDSCLTIIVPWVVLEELDLLKSRRDGPRSQVADRAQGAIIFIQKILARKSPALKGQKVSESADTNAYDNDDRILDCCRYFAKSANHRVVLYSNDRNLCNKCMVHHIDSYGSVDQRRFSQLVREAPLRRHQTSKETLKPYKASESPTRSSTQTRSDDVMNQVKPATNHSSKSPSDRIPMENTSSLHSKHASPSYSKRLKQATARIEHKSEARPWNSAIVDRYRAKQQEQQQQNSPKPASSTAYQDTSRTPANPRHKASSAPVVEPDLDDDMAMDIDVDYTFPQGTSDSIYSTTHHSN